MLIGHQKQWNFLKKITEVNKISHSYLFIGQEKLGKKKVALEWASLLFNENINFKKSYNPDLLLVEPDGKEIKISQIRELIQKLSLKFYSAPFKIAIIDKAHLMNKEAQNALLKTLEEPKGKTILILITEFPEMLFSTILSRVQVVKFYPVKQEEIIKYLKKQEIKDREVEEISKTARGKPGLAIDFFLEPNKLENEKKIIKELINISKASLSIRFQYVKKLAEKEDVRDILNIWLKYFRDTDIYKFKNIIKQIQEINFLLSKANINPKLALEVLILEL